MTDEPAPPPETAPIPALLVPADPGIPVRIIDLSEGKSSLAVLQKAVGGAVEVQAHDEGDLWLNDEGRLIDLPINVRVNHWMVNDSTRARHHHVGESLVMYGDVVITGPPDHHGDTTAVHQHMIDYFQNLHLSPNAMKDWDIRSTEIVIIIDQSDPPPDLGDLGSGL